MSRRNLFWGERFQDPDEEDIWEELKQMLLNPPSEQEIALKKQEEQAWIDSILEKAFPEEPKAKAEPYLNYEDLLLPEDAQKYRQKQAGLGENSLVSDNQGQKISHFQGPKNPYEEINSRSDWSEELKSQKRAEVAKIQEIARQREREINIENAKEHAKNFGGAALEIGSAAIPGYGGAKLAGAVGKKLAPVIGRKIAGQVKKAIATGAVTGGIEGAIRGSLSDDNVAKTIASDAILGAIGGASLGAIGGNVQKVVRELDLKKYDDLLKSKKINKQEKNEFIKAGNKYYQDYEQGIKTHVEGLGYVKLPSGGLKETAKQSPEHIVDVINLSKNLRKSENLGIEPPKHSHQFDITKFHHLRGKNVDYQIAENAKGDKYFHKITNPYLTGPKPEGEGLLSTSTSTNNIIPPSQPNLNPSNINTQTNLGQSFNQNNAIKPPKSDWKWREWLKRKRKGLL